MAYHASEFNEKKLTESKKRPFFCIYNDQELIEIGKHKKQRIDLEYESSTALFNALNTKDFEISTIFNYCDRSRELKLTLRTDKTPEKIAQIPEAAEFINDDPIAFFNTLGEWMETILEARSESIQKNIKVSTGMHG